MSDQHVPAVRGAAVVRTEPRLIDLLRRRFIEVLLLAVAGVILAVTLVQTVRIGLQGDGRTDDLVFARTLDELAMVLQAGGQDRVAVLEPAVVEAGGLRLAVDTIAIIADLDDRPGARTGGFIADHVRVYNDHVIRRELLAATYGAAVRDVATAGGPSILRTVRDADGTRRLSERPNAFTLAVRSPHAERSWREVRTADWTRSGGLLGLQGDLPLSRETPNGSRARLNGRDCSVQNADAGILLYCTSELGRDVNRFYDLGFELPPGGLAAATVRAFLYRPRDVWYNGAVHRAPPDALRAGDVLDVDRIGPLVLSVADRGTLAAGQWINGRDSFANQRLGTLSFFATAGRSAAGGQTAPLVLALDAALSQDLEAEAAAFVARHGDTLRRMSVVVVDVVTGELRAIAEPHRDADGEPLLAFEPVLIGSVAKPLVAAAILARRPELGSLSVNWAGDSVASVAGIALRRPFANAANGCRGSIRLDDFIRCSSNQYAAELMMRALLADGYRPDADSIVPRAVLERSAVGSGLAEAFDVDAAAYRTAFRTAYSWASIVDAERQPQLRPGAVLLPWESRPWIIFPQTEGTAHDLLARYAFGGWENRWTLLGAAEAYARVATGRDVRLRMLRQPRTAAERLPAHVDAAFRRLRPGLRSVGVSGTGAGLAPRLQGALPGNVTVMAKTGTLNEATDRFRALALVVGRSDGDEAAPLTCGLAAVMYFEFENTSRRGRERVPLPAAHLDFAREGFTNVVARHWQRVSGCAATPAGGTE